MKSRPPPTVKPCSPWHNKARKADGIPPPLVQVQPPDKTSGRSWVNPKNHKTEDHKMEYHGFRSISEYERECARLDFQTRRIPFHDNNGGSFIALVTSCPGHPTGTSVESWTLFTADEKRTVLDGIISGGTMDPAKYMRDGLDVNYLGKLAAHGFYPDAPQDAPPPAPAEPEYPVGEGGQICFLF